MKTAAIILARGGSIGLPKKNILTFCGKPLISWTIQHCIKSGVENVYVSSDCNKILEISSEYGAIEIKRPIELSGHEATSESAWFHALEHLEKNNLFPELIIAPQVTSPIRHDNDIRKGLDKFIKNGYDSLFSASLAEDLFLWHQKQGVLEGINHNWNNSNNNSNRIINSRPPVYNNSSNSYSRGSSSGVSSGGSSRGSSGGVSSGGSSGGSSRGGGKIN